MLAVLALAALVVVVHGAIQLGQRAVAPEAAPGHTWIIRFDMRRVASAADAFRQLTEHDCAHDIDAAQSHVMHRYTHLESTAGIAIVTCNIVCRRAGDETRDGPCVAPPRLPSYVLSAERDAPVAIVATRRATDETRSWALDRIDERARTLDGHYTYDYTGVNVDAYVLDSGINAHHDEFVGDGRVTLAFSAIGDGRGARDCHGHGTFVASQLGGASFGVAKRVHIVSVRVLGCAGTGSTSGVLAGLDYVASRRASLAARARTAVVVMSLAGPRSLALNGAVDALVAAANVVVVVAAGNTGGDACLVSPASAARAIAVAASTQYDTVPSFTNRGPCVALFAPGRAVPGATFAESSPSPNDDTTVLSGTSVSAPLVAGTCALLIERLGSAVAAPPLVRDLLLRTATYGALAGTSVFVSTPNLLVYTRGALASSPAPPTPLPPTSAAPALAAAAAALALA